MKVPHIIALPLMLSMLSACGGPPGGSDGIRPGMWNSKLSIRDAQGEIWAAEVDRCIYTADAAEFALSALRTSQLRECSAGTTRAASGKLAIETSCPGQGQTLQASVPMIPGSMAAKINLRGSYTPTTVDGELVAQLEDTLEPMRFNGTLSARRTGNC